MKKIIEDLRLGAAAYVAQLAIVCAIGAIILIFANVVG